MTLFIKQCPVGAPRPISDLRAAQLQERRTSSLNLSSGFSSLTTQGHKTVGYIKIVKTSSTPTTYHSKIILTPT